MNWTGDVVFGVQAGASSFLSRCVLLMVGAYDIFHNRSSRHGMACTTLGTRNISSYRTNNC